MRFVTAASLAGLALLSACVPRAAPPAPAPSRPIPVPAVPNPAPAPPQAADWRDWPLSPGTWRYARSGRGSSATFGTSERNWSLRLTCRAAGQALLMEKVGHGGTALTIRTTTLTRTVAAASMAHADGWPPNTLDATLPVRDPLLDAMGFSRGRFVVEGGVPGALVIPAWAEILRVVEDCRG